MTTQQLRRTQREDRILLRLNGIRFATLKQLQKMEKLAGYRNAHRILSEMEEDKLIKSVRRGYKIYYLAHKGRDRLGIEAADDVKFGQITHNLMRNDLYIQFGMPKSWKVEKVVTLNEEKIFPDAAYTVDNDVYFIEIDNAQKMTVNKEKIAFYKKLFVAITTQRGQNPLLVWRTSSEGRKIKLKEMCKEFEVQHFIC